VFRKVQSILLHIYDCFHYAAAAPRHRRRATPRPGNVAPEIEGREDLKNRHPPPHIMHSKPHQQHTTSCFGFNGSSGFLVRNLTLVGHTLPNNLLWNDIIHTETNIWIYTIVLAGQTV